MIARIYSLQEAGITHSAIVDVVRTSGDFETAHTRLTRNFPNIKTFNFLMDCANNEIYKKAKMLQVNQSMEMYGVHILMHPSDSIEVTYKH